MSEAQPKLDLTTLEQFENWLGIDLSENNAGVNDKQNAQDCITAASIEFLRLTGNLPDRNIPTESLFVAPQSFDEWYDGNGSNILPLYHMPIVSVTALLINGLAIAASSAVNSPGYVIHQSKTCLAFRQTNYGGGANGRAYRQVFGSSFQFFSEGIQNIEVQYTAGYNGVPYDVELAVRRMVAINYKRKMWTDQSQQSLAQGAGTVTFRSWIYPPEIDRAILEHTRRAAI